MKTIIFDIDGTLTDMWPVEKAVLLAMLGEDKISIVEKLRDRGVRNVYELFCRVSGIKVSRKELFDLYNQTTIKLINKNLIPTPVAYPLVRWVLANKSKYRFVYATGGRSVETEHVLRRLGLLKIFDQGVSINRDNYRFSKGSGLPYKIIKRREGECVVVTDSKIDCLGAKKAGIDYSLILPGQSVDKAWVPGE